MRNLSLWIPLFAGRQAFYGDLLPAVFLGLPSLSSGNVLSDYSGNGNDGTIQGVHTQTRYNNLGVQRGMLEGNGEDYVSLTKAPNIGTYTFLWIGVLPKYASNGTIAEFEYDGADTDTRLIQHVGANTLRLGNKVATVNQNMDIAGVPENELIIYMLSVTGTTVEQYVFHKSGVINQSDTLSNVQVQTPANSTLFGRFDGSIPAQSGFSSSLIPFYNEAKLEPFGQNAYDLLIANNGVLASSLLNTLSPTGATIAPATWTAQATDITSKELGTPDLDITLVSNAIPTGGSTSVFLRESANVTEKLELRMVITSGNLEIYEYDPTATLLGTVTAIETDSMQVVVRGDTITIFRNGGTTSVFSNTLQAETEYGTQMSVVIAGTHTIDLKFEDTFGKALANDIELMQHLDADAYYRLGQLAEQLGYDAQDMTANEVRILNGVFNFLESDSALTIPFDERINSDTSVLSLLYNFYGASAVNQNFWGQNNQSDQFFVNATTNYRKIVNYVTVDAQSIASGAITNGKNDMSSASLNESSHTIELYKNGEQLTLSTQNVGTGGRNVFATDFVIGNSASAGGNQGLFGTISKPLFLHQLATEALMRWLQVHLRIRQYYQDSDNILQPDAMFIGNNADVWNITTNQSMNPSGNSAGTVLSEIGSYGTIGYFDILSVLPATLSSISGVFNVELDLVDAVNTLLYIESGTDFIQLFTTATQLVLRYYDGSNNDASYTLSGMGLADADNCEIGYKVGSSGLALWVNGKQVATDATAFVAFTSYDADLTVIGASNSSTGATSYDKSIYQASLKFNSTLSAIDIMRHRNLISANGSEWYKFLDDTYTMTKLNNSSGDNLLASGGADDTLSGATADGGFAPNGEVYIDFTSASHLNIGLTSLTINNKRYSIWVQPSATAVSTTVAYVMRLHIDNDNSLRIFFPSTSGRLQVQYEGSGLTSNIIYNSILQDVNYFIELDIPSSGGLASLKINGVHGAGVTLQADVVGTALTDSDTVVGSINVSNTSPLLSLATNLQISEIPADGLSDYPNNVGELLT